MRAQRRRQIVASFVWRAGRIVCRSRSRHFVANCSKVRSPGVAAGVGVSGVGGNFPLSNQSAQPITFVLRIVILDGFLRVRIDGKSIMDTAPFETEVPGVRTLRPFSTGAAAAFS